MKFDENGLLPAIIQDANTKQVLMLGYMNQAAFDQTLATKLVTFYSRSKERIWVKGETSNNVLNLISWKLDCDQDAILIQAKPAGPTCHNGTTSCWGDAELDTIDYLEKTIEDRKINYVANSYVSSLFRSGINKIAQKVGEEAVEVVIEAKDDNQDLFLNEAADLLFHYLILLNAKNTSFKTVKGILENRK